MSCRVIVLALALLIFFPSWYSSCSVFQYSGPFFFRTVIGCMFLGFLDYVLIILLPSSIPLVPLAVLSPTLELVL